MKKEYDFSTATRGAVVPVPEGKIRVMILLDQEVLDWFRAQVHEMGGGDYQALINSALRNHMTTCHVLEALKSERQSLRRSEPPGS